jgi:hypothetical protein
MKLFLLHFLEVLTRFLFYFFCACFFMSCQKKNQSQNERVLTKGALLSIIRDSGLQVEIILPKDLASGVDCQKYGIECLSGYYFEFKKMTFILIEYENRKKSEEMARRLKQCSFYNFFIDDIGKEIQVKKVFQEKLKELKCY